MTKQKLKFLINSSQIRIKGKFYMLLGNYYITLTKIINCCFSKWILKKVNKVIWVYGIKSNRKKMLQCPYRYLRPTSHRNFKFDLLFCKLRIILLLSFPLWFLHIFHSNSVKVILSRLLTVTFYSAKTKGKKACHVTSLRS